MLGSKHRGENVFYLLLVPILPPHCNAVFKATQFIKQKYQCVLEEKKSIFSAKLIRYFFFSFSLAFFSYESTHV